MKFKPYATYLSIAAAMTAVLLVLLFYNPMNSRLWRTIYPPGSKVRTTSTEIVKITVGKPSDSTGLTLAIPKAYLVNAQNWRGGAQEVVNIEARLPDLQPAEAIRPARGRPGEAEYEESMARTRNAIAIRLFESTATIPVGMPRHRERIVATNRSRDGSRKYEPISSNYFGLEAYRDLSCSQTPFPGSAPYEELYCADSLKTDYLPTAPDPATVYIICTRVGDPRFEQHMGCQAYSQFAGRELNYVFRASELHRWREFYDGVQKLLNQFQAQANIAD